MVSRFRTCLAFLTLLAPTALAAQVSTSWSACKTDSLSTFNCASYYSGTVTLASRLKAPGVDEQTSVVATVSAGKVTCKASYPDTPEFTAPGMLAVEHDNNANAGGYEIRVWCPEGPGIAVQRRDSPAIEILNQESRDYRTHEGKESYEHPDADEVNGVTGTVTTTWSLVRK